MSYGISKTSVQRLLEEHGVAFRYQGLSSSQVTEAIELYRAGHSVAHLAGNLGLSPSSIYDALKRSGVEMRSAHEPDRRRRRSNP